MVEVLQHNMSDFGSSVCKGTLGDAVSKLVKDGLGDQGRQIHKWLEDYT